jgi:hypothetical protein
MTVSAYLRWLVLKAEAQNTVLISACEAWLAACRHQAANPTETKENMEVLIKEALRLTKLALAGRALSRSPRNFREGTGMKEVIVNTQAEFDAALAPDTQIIIKDTGGLYIYVPNLPTGCHVVARESSHVVAWESSHVEARGSSHIFARGSSHVVAWESSHVEARESSHVVARESSHVEAWESSHVEALESSHVEARESSHVVAWGSSHVEALGSSHVVARGSSHVVALGSSHVEARESSHVVALESSHVEALESSHVVAWESSHVEARESSHVVARESSHVEAWESSHVEARGNVSVSLRSEDAVVVLFMFAVCIALAKGKITKKAKTATIIRAAFREGVPGWLDQQGIGEKKTVVLFKKVSADFKTQENTPNQTDWTIGRTVNHPAWNPTAQECGPGKFHGCSQAYFCDEFRFGEGDRYIAIEIAKKDLYAWPNPGYPNKIAFRSGKVLYECDRYGVRL